MKYASALVLIACLLSAGLGLKLGHFKRALTSTNEYRLLPTTFTYWDSEPVTKHLGLSFTNPDELARGRAYPRFTAVWLGLLYACMKPLELLGVPYAVGQNIVVFLTFSVMLWLIVAALSLSARGRPTELPGGWALWLPLTVLAFCTVATLPALWVASLIANPEGHLWFIATMGVAFISVLDFQRRPLGRAGFLTAVGIALIAPFHAVFVFIALAFLATPVGHAKFSGVVWSRWRSQGIMIGAVIAFSIISQDIVLWIGGWHSAGSGVLFRSGLDGSTEYFTTTLQALFYPSYSAGRRWHLLPLLAAAAIVVAGTFALSRPLAERMFRQLIFCWSPALLMLVVFPQAVSIHPYLSDFGLAFPAAFCIAFWVAQPEVQDLLAERRAISLAAFIALTGLLVTNYLDLARAA